VDLSRGATLCAFFGLVHCAYSQGIHRTYDYNNREDAGWTVLERKQGGFLIGGQSDAPGLKGLVIAVDSFGVTEWVTELDSSKSGTDDVLQLLELDNGAVVAVGTYHDSAEGARDIFIMRLSPHGDIVSYVLLDAGYNDRPIAVNLAYEDTLVVAGWFQNPDTPTHTTVFLLFVDTAGNVARQVDHFGSSSVYPSSLRATFDGGFVVAGDLASVATNSFDLFLLKTDGLGNMKWIKRYGDSFDQFGGEVLTIADSGYTICGNHKWDDDDWDGQVVRVDTSGDMVWEMKYDRDNGSYDVLKAIAPTSGGYVVAGSTLVGPDQLDAWLLRLNNGGDTIWTRRYTFYGQDSYTFPNEIVQTADSGFAVVGYIINNLVATRNDIWFLKTDGHGQTCEPPPCAWSVGTERLTLLEPLIYPNPSSGPISVRTPTWPCVLEVVDLQGRTMTQVLIEGSTSAIDLTSLRPGVYLLALVSESGTTMSRLLKL
jgi:hypothetical protein